MGWNGQQGRGASAQENGAHAQSANEVPPCLCFVRVRRYVGRWFLACPAFRPHFFGACPKKRCRAAKEKRFFYLGGSTIRVSAAALWKGRFSPDLGEGEGAYLGKKRRPVGGVFFIYMAYFFISGLTVSGSAVMVMVNLMPSLSAKLESQSRKSRTCASVPALNILWKLSMKMWEMS